MRVGATVLFKNNTCWQSYGWSCLRPLGNLQSVIEALDEYECDEIALIRPVREMDTEQSFFQDVQLLNNTTSLTPLSFGGGIRTISQLLLLNGAPVERLLLTSAFLNRNLALLEYIKDTFGRQSIQCVLPCVIYDKKKYIYNPSERMLVPFQLLDLDVLRRYANEVIIHDIENEGRRDCFNRNLINDLQFPAQQLVLSGGIGSDTICWAKSESFAACLIDNRALHKEYSILGHKRAAKL